jgi:predicted DNA-binding transcriptional regulator AlpA
MPRRKHVHANPNQSKANTKERLPEAAVTSECVLIPGPRLRRMLGVSAVTLWRWRHNKQTAFPLAKSINGRLYFPWPEVQAWLARQQEAA